jgi:hypothetical protein
MSRPWIAAAKAPEAARGSLYRPMRERAEALMVWTPPTALVCQSGGVENHSREASVAEVSTIGLDLAKTVLQVHTADASGAVVFR